jgi:hypothetical protein
VVASRTSPLTQYEVLDIKGPRLMTASCFLGGCDIFGETLPL